MMNITMHILVIAIFFLTVLCLEHCQLANKIISINKITMPAYNFSFFSFFCLFLLLDSY